MAFVVLRCYDIIFFFFNDTATTEIYTLSLHDALPISIEHADEHDLCVPEDRREAGADVLDGTVPQDQVGGEERAGEPRPGAHAPRTRPDAPVLPPREQQERRHRVQTPEEGTRGRRDVCVAVEDPGEGDREGAGQRGQRRTPAGETGGAQPAFLVPSPRGGRATRRRPRPSAPRAGR